MFKSKAYATLLLSGLAVSAGTLPAHAADPAPFQFDKPAVAAVAQTIESGNDLRKMAASRFDLFFGGEHASRTLSFFALPAEASDTARLVLTLQTAISAAPEQSSMAVRINGTEVGSTGLVAGDPRRIEFVVPAGVIHPGYNAVTIAADHRHRVDCSINATYELWTKIDPDKSGLIYAAAARPGLSLVDLLPLSGTENGRTALRVILPAGAQMTEFDRAMNVVQALTILGNFSHPSVEFATTPGSGPGIDIYLGTRSELAGLLGADHKAITSDEHIVVDNYEAGSRKRLVISGLDAADLDTRALELVSMAGTDRPVGTPAGLTALSNLKGRMLMPGEKVSLSDLGYTSQHFSGRYTTSQLNFTMPSDFYPGDYASVNFHLSALYAGGLASEAVLTIKANDKEVANIALSSTRAGEIRDQRLPIPFSALRPGQNTLKIEARLPSRLDSACESVDKASASVRLAISDKSYLDIPEFARVGRYPDIAVLTSGLTPKHLDDAEPVTALFVPSYEKHGINAAATFMAKMAYSSGRIKKVAFTSVLPELETANLIAFGSFDTLPSELTRRMNLDFINIKTAVKALPNEVASLDNTLLPSADDLQAAEKSKAAQIVDYADAFLQAPVSHAGVLLESAQQVVSAKMEQMNLKYLPSLLDDGRRETFAPSADASLVVAQQSAESGVVWTVVAARKSDAIAAQTDVLTDYNVWNKLGGAIQSFTETGTVIEQKFSDRQYLFQTQPITVSNARLIAAGWLANNAEIYIGALLIAAILLGFGTYTVLVTGRRNHG